MSPDTVAGSGIGVAGSGIGAGGTFAAEVIEVLGEDDELLRSRRLGAAHLRAELNGLTSPPAPGEPAGDERGELLLAFLRERARNGLLDPTLTVPVLAPAPGEGSR